MNTTAERRLAIVVNGESVTVGAASLEAALVALGYDLTWAAVALNEEIVRRDDLAGTSLSNGDRIEVLSPMSGG